MYERMLDKNSKPADTQIQEYLGNLSYGRLTAMEEYLYTHYQLVKEIRFPFGNSYGWGINTAKNPVIFVTPFLKRVLLLLQSKSVIIKPGLSRMFFLLYCPKHGNCGKTDILAVSMADGFIIEYWQMKN